MQICPDHWSSLRTAVEERGLNHLVSRNGEEAARRMVNISQGSEDPADFDPLMAANMAIISYFLAQAGIEHLDDAGCPLCIASKDADGDDLSKNWIEGATDDVLMVAKSKGLIVEQ